MWWRVAVADAGGGVGLAVRARARVRTALFVRSIATFSVRDVRNPVVVASAVDPSVHELNTTGLVGQWEQATFFERQDTELADQVLESMCEQSKRVFGASLLTLLTHSAAGLVHWNRGAWAPAASYFRVCAEMLSESPSLAALAANGAADKGARAKLIADGVMSWAVPYAAVCVKTLERDRASALLDGVLAFAGLAPAGPSEPLRAWTRYMQGILAHVSAGPTGEAQAAYEAALASFTKRRDYFSAGCALLNLGGLVHAGDRARALEFYDRCIALGEEKRDLVKGEDKVELAVVCGHALVQKGLLQAADSADAVRGAIQLFEDAMALFHAALPRDAPELRPVLLRLARFYAAQSRMMQADGLFRSLLAALQRPTTAADMLLRSQVLSEYADLQRAMGLAASADVHRAEHVSLMLRAQKLLHGSGSSAAPSATAAVALDPSSASLLVLLDHLPNFA